MPMHPRYTHHRLLPAAVGLACFLALGFGIVLQEWAGLVPCPMCIVQRYALILVGLFCLVSPVVKFSRFRLIPIGLAMLFSAFGAFVAARQSWLQWYPPDAPSCGRDFYGMIETFALRRAIPMLFRGSGDCSKVDWTFLGGSMANWSFVFFVASVLVLLFIAHCTTQNARLDQIHERHAFFD